MQAGVLFHFSGVKAQMALEQFQNLCSGPAPSGPTSDMQADSRFPVRHGGRTLQKK
jgi:hypothetical protein